MLSVSQVQEAASRGLKFVSVIPQYHYPTTLVGSSSLASPANSATKNAHGDHTPLENEDPGAVDVSLVPARVDQCLEPSPSPTGEVPLTEQPSSPLGEGEDREASLRKLSPTLDGPDVDLLDVHEEQCSGSKYVIPGSIDMFKERATAFQEKEVELQCRHRSLPNKRNFIKQLSGPPNYLCAAGMTSERAEPQEIDKQHSKIFF